MPTVPQMRALARPAFAAFLVIAAFGCSSSDNNPVAPPPIYSSITITGPDTVLIGGDVQFTAVVIDTGGNPVPSPAITFRSYTTGIATINNAGIATGVAEGRTTIVADGGGITSNGETLDVLQGFGWVDQSSAAPTLANLRSVEFVSTSEGWIVGDLGTILHTVNSGKTWSAQTSFSTSYTLNAVDFLSPTIGCVVGSAGRVLRTTNGGTTWSVVPVPTSSGLNDIHFQDADRGWIVGDGGTILRTNNGGGSWTRVTPSPTVANLEQVSFPAYTLGGNPPADPYGHGWAVGAGGTILSSDDFGQTWHIVTPFVVTDGLFGVVRRTKTDAIAVGTNARVLTTIASADSAVWQLEATPAPLTNFTSVSWSPQSPLPGNAWAVGKQSSGPALAAVFYSSDGGVSWTPQALPASAPLTGNGLEDVTFVDDNHGWAVGAQGLILHTATGGR